MECLLTHGAAFGTSWGKADGKPECEGLLVGHSGRTFEYAIRLLGIVSPEVSGDYTWDGKTNSGNCWSVQ